MADSVNRWYLPPEEQVGRGLYQSMVDELTNLPAAPPGSPFPPDDFVRRETADLRQQRAVLVESRPSLTEAALIR